MVKSKTIPTILQGTTTSPSTSSTMVDEMTISKKTSTTVKRLTSTEFSRFLTNDISKSLYPSNALSPANGTSVKNSPTTVAMLTSVKNPQMITIHTTTKMKNPGTAFETANMT